MDYKKRSKNDIDWMKNRQMLTFTIKEKKKEDSQEGNVLSEKFQSLKTSEH